MLISQTNPAAEPWVDIKAVEKHIALCGRTIRKMVKEGKLPARPVRNGARTYWRFQLSEVDAAIKALLETSGITHKSTSVR